MTRRLVRFFQGFRIRVIGLVLISIIPVLVVFSWQASDVRQRSRENAATDTLRLSRLTAERESATVQGAQTLLADATALGSDDFADPATCHAYLTRMLKQMPTVTNAFTVGGDGTVLCSAEPLPDSMFLADRPAVQDAIATSHFAARVEATGDLVDSPGILAVLPVPNNQRVALIGVTLKLGVGLETFLTNLGLPARSETAVIDSKAQVLASAPGTNGVGQAVPMRELAGQVQAGGVEGSAEGIGRDGIERVYSYSDVAGTGESAFALVGVPTSVAFAAGNHEMRASLVAALVVALVAIALALLIAELSVSQPVRHVVGTVRQLASGNLSARTSMRGGGEVGEVADAIDDMAGALQAREQALRAASDERERLLAELLDAQEEERRKVAADIHDDTIQTMIAAGMEIQLLRVELGDQGRRDRLQHVEQSITEAVNGLRNLIFELEPPDGAGAALEDSIEQYLENSLRPTPIETEVEANPHLVLAGPERQVVFRNLREAALNAARHGKAQTVMIGLGMVDNGVLVTVRDDGRGMAPGEEQKPGHHGVRVMRERTEALGGWFRLESQLERGTTVSFWFPSKVPVP